MIKSSCVISEFVFNSIIITFLYINMCIVYNSYKCFNFLIMLSTLKFSFYYFFNIKNNLTLFLILKMLIFKRSFLLFLSLN